MQDQQIIRKVREEHERLREITAGLKDAITRPPGRDPGEWLDTVRARFEQFRAHLIKRIALEEMGGFLNIVVERNPSLAKQVEHLRETHKELIEMAGEAMSELRDLPADNTDALRQAVLLVRMALSEVEFQEKAETLLVSFVFTQDTGVCD